MEKKRTMATDIAEIAALLDGKVDFKQISFNQVLTTEHGKSINDLLFVSKQFGIWFYTSRFAFESDVSGVDRHVIRYRTHKDWTNYRNNNPYSNK